jgi:uncharacterized protein YcfL
MRRLVLVLAAALMLLGCASSLQSAYDDRAREECERESRGSDRLNC